MLHEAELYSVVVWAIFFGIVFSIFYISLQKKSIGSFISKLIETNSYDLENSKSLNQLGITQKLSKNIIYSCVKSQHGLIRIIGFLNKTSHKAPAEFTNETPNDDTCFYIDKASVQDALKKYNISKSNKLYMTICIIVLFLIACVASTVISRLTSYAGNVFKGYGSYKPQQEDVQENTDITANDTENTENSNDIINNNENSDFGENADNETSEEDASTDNEITQSTDNETTIRPTIPKGPLS